MAHDYDTIIIGSGFGGAVTACRLAEQGLKVLVLERGRRWATTAYPRKPDDAWIWDVRRPEKLNGWIDLRVFPRMAVAQGAGVGGGSLIYANVSIPAKPHSFDQGWPPEITYAGLKPYYDRAGQMLNVQTIPAAQATERTKLVREAAAKSGHGDRFMLVPLAVTFDPDYSPAGPDPYNARHSKTWTNAQGVQQGTCVHCGNCDIGCEVRAKNTLDLNYIAVAEAKGAEIRPLHLVNAIEPHEGGYRVRYDRLEGGRRVAGTATGARVVVAAGSLNSTELLLRCRDQHRTLPRLSAKLGHGWCSNGDFLTPAIYPGRKVSPTRGPTISCAIDFLDGSIEGRRFFVEDGGFPDVLGNHLQAVNRSWFSGARNRLLYRAFGRHLGRRNPLETVMPWFGQAVDAADGRMRLARDWWRPWAAKQLMLDWDVTRSEPTMKAFVAMHKTLSEATGGTPLVPPSWSLARYLVTPHPLGGCNMGTAVENGVVDHRGQVFGYRNLFVADGSIVPLALGLNPSRTIAALAERNAEQMLTRG